MTEQTTPMQEVAQPTEAGFSTNMYLKHPKMGRLQFTFRGATSQDWGNVLADVDRFTHFMSDKGWKFDGENDAAPAAATPAPQAAQKTPAPQPQSIVGNMQVKDTSINTMLIKKVKIEPQPDGKIKVELFAEGHQYADLKMTMGLDATLKALDGTGYEWDAGTLGKVGEYNMSFYADWRNSEKLNSKGNPYKNVVRLRSEIEAGPMDRFGEGPAEEDSPF